MAALGEAISSHVKNALNYVYTMLPAVVTKVYEYNGTTVVDVEYGVSRVTPVGYETENGYGLPICWPSAGGCVITFPIKIGDTVLVHFAMRDSGGWVTSDTSEATDPDSVRLHNIMDAFAVPCTTSYTTNIKPDQDGIKLSSSKTEIRIKNNGTIELGEGATERLIKGNQFLSKFLDHKHEYVDSKGPAATPTPSLTLGVSLAPATPDTIENWETTLSEVSKTK